MDPSVLGGRSPGVSQQAPLSVLRGGSATSPIYISSGESYSSSSGKSDSSAGPCISTKACSWWFTAKSLPPFVLCDSPPVLTYDLSRVRSLRGPTPPIAMKSLGVDLRIKSELVS
ncbi:hypothetical protein F2Q70_00000611 [Brassica cretica]|uniref:Uncharacterized protein n=1 Tax=Brassica cretica TaxID=69181 RepID=A0A8S9IWC4_BRACR|nr:hypothetical protein F2Q70_00000611 [Brassica cretica]